MRLLAQVRHALPHGHTLPLGAWRVRHRALLALLWAHAVWLPIFAMTRGLPTLHSLTEGLLVAVFAVAAMIAGSRRRLASVFVSIGLITSSALLIHIWDGVIEGHFHFFVMIVLLALYEDWFAFLVAAAYVVLHHGLMGVFHASSVYNHPDAIAHPWKWAIIHGIFVVGAGVGLVVSWRLNEDVRAQKTEAYRQARESEERFRNSFENAPIGMALAAVGTADRGRFLQVNRAMCEITGYTEEALRAMRFSDITHPEDVDSSVAAVAELLDGRDTIQVEKRYVRGDGEVVWGLASISLVRDQSGTPLHTIAQIQDITEQKLARERLTYQAYHDALTGLPNRRQLMEDLNRCLGSARAEHPATLVMFDLDGFKAYNDAFGHAAGDALLTRLAQRLAASVNGRAGCYRMGGDEFCLLSSEGETESVLLVKAARRALSENGDGFAITASYGSVAIPVEAADEAGALRIADQRMYALKGAGRASAGRQASDALLSALAERNPDLGVHQRDVTELCEAVARTLSVPEEEVGPLLQAAALHDVGKIAIPDAILDKPAALDDAEWEFMRAHTLIGERILAAAVALTRAAKFVRSSHERFEGGGYPDGLAGNEIPLGARIISVCDAFDAMTSDRPYSAAVSVEVAVAELRRNAGSQFDPDVVEAFVAALSEMKDHPADAAA